MRDIPKTGWLVLICIFISTGVQAETSGSFPLLKIAPDARSVALGEAGVAGSEGAMAAFHNPALLPWIDGSQAAFGYSDWLLDLNIQTAAMLFSYGNFAVGLSVNAFNVPDIERRVLPSDEPIETFSAHDFAGGMSLAYRFDNFSLGVTGRWIHELIYVDEANGFSTDFGAAYRLESWGVTFGAAVRNIGSMEALDEEKSPLPQNAAFGLSGRIFTANDMGLNGLADVKHLFDDDTRLHAGIEGFWKEHVFLRLGYQTGSELRTVSGGVGLGWDRFKFDYAYQPLSEDFEASHRFGFSINF
jgi:hypothetical protein